MGSPVFYFFGVNFGIIEGFGALNLDLIFAVKIGGLG